MNYIKICLFKVNNYLFIIQVVEVKITKYGILNLNLMCFE